MRSKAAIGKSLARELAAAGIARENMKMDVWREVHEEHKIQMVGGKQRRQRGFRFADKRPQGQHFRVGKPRNIRLVTAERKKDTPQRRLVVVQH